MISIEDDNTLKIINFEANQLNAAIELKCVHKIVALPMITPVKEMPRYIVGLLNLSGTIIPIVDLYIRLENQKPSRYNINTPILICQQTSGKKIGLVVNKVNDISCIDRSMAEKYEFSNDKLFSASIKYQSKIIYLLNIDYLIKDKFNEGIKNEE